MAARQESEKVMKTVIVNINLEYVFDVATDEEAEKEANNVELPSGYISDSFEIVNILDGDQTKGIDRCAGCRHYGENTCCGVSPEVCYEK